MQTLAALLNKNLFLKLLQDESGANLILRTLMYTSGAERKKINNTIYDLFAEMYKALSATSYTGGNRKKDSDIIMMNNNKSDLSYTGVGDKSSKRKNYFSIDSPKKVAEIASTIVDEEVFIDSRN